MLKTIKGKLIAYFSVAFLSVAVIICAYYYYTNYHLQEDQIIENVGSNIDYIQSNINRMLIRCEEFSDKIYWDDQITKILTRQYDSRKSYYSLDRDLVNAIGNISLYLDNDIISKYINGIVIKGNNGRTIKYGLDADYINLEELTQTDWFQKNKDNDHLEWLPMIGHDSPVIQDKYQLPVVRKLILNYTGRNVGWMFISVSPSVIEDVVKDYELSSDDILIICDRDRNCIYSSDSGLCGTNVAGLLDSWGDEREINYNDQKWFVVKDHSEYSGFMIIQLINNRVFRNQSEILLKSTVMMIIIILVVIFVLTSLLSNILMKPISNITRRMKIIATGDFSVDESLEGDDEIGTLGKGINRLSKCNAALYSRRKKHFIFDSINTITAPSFR